MLYRIVYFCIAWVLLCPGLGLAQTVPEMFYYSDLLTGLRTSGDMHAAIKHRFKRTNLNEILFADRPDLTAPKFSNKDLENILTNLAEMRSHIPDLQSFLSEKPRFPVWHVFPDGSAREIPNSIIEQWKLIPKNLQSIFLQRPKSANDIKSLVNVFMQKRSEENLQNIQRAVLGMVLSERDIFHLATDTKLTPYDYRAYFKMVIGQLALKVKEHELPGKVMDTLPAFAERLGLAKFEDERKGLIITPMSRFEAIFKGVGPGECVRTCITRYADAFYKDSIHLKIMKDGEEIAYVGLYKTRLTSTSKKVKVWYIETIQGPILSDSKNKSDYVKAIVKALQIQALRSDAMLAFPAESHNAMNYKEIVAEMYGRPEKFDGKLVVVDFEKPEDEKFVKGLANTIGTPFDKEVKRASGYGAKYSINSLEFNSGGGRALLPQPGQPDWVWKKSFQLFQGLTSDAKETEVLSVEKKIEIVTSFYDEYTGLKILYDQMLETTNAEDKTKLMRAIFKESPIELASENFATHYSYVEFQTKNVVQSYERAQRLKSELALKAKTGTDWLVLFELADIEKDLFRRFIVASVPDIEKMVGTDFPWLDYYRMALSYQKDIELDYYLSRTISRNITTTDQYLEILAINSGEQIKGTVMGDKALQNRFVAETWENFLPKNSSQEQITYLTSILKRLDDSADLSVRRKFLMAQKNLELFPELSHIAIPAGVSDFFSKQITILNYEAVLNVGQKMKPEDFKSSWNRLRSKILLDENQIQAIDEKMKRVQKLICLSVYK